LEVPTCLLYASNHAGTMTKAGPQADFARRGKCATVALPHACREILEIFSFAASFRPWTGTCGTKV
jgi:hypothetical protein